MSDENLSSTGDNGSDESFDVAADEAKVVSSDRNAEFKSANTINRAKPRRSKAPVVAGVFMAALLGGAVYAVFARGGDEATSRMVSVPRNIDTTPAGQQLAASENYRQSLNSANQQGSQQAASTTGSSFLATPDEPTRPVDLPKDPIPLVAPKLPPANKKVVEVRDRVVYRDRYLPAPGTQPQQPQTDWASIDAMTKRMENQSDALASSWHVGKSKNTIVIEQDLYTAPDGRPTGVQVRAPGSPQNVSAPTEETRREPRSQRERQTTRNPIASPVEAIPQDTSYQADLDTSLPYLSVAPAESEPRLQVDTGQRYGSGAPVFNGDYYAAAGSITFAVIVNGADTDTPGPVVAKIMRGPLKGSRLIGSFQENDETTAMVVQFDRVVLPDGTNLDTSAYAIDAAQGTLAVKSEYDGRYIQRYAPRLAGAFLSGIGKTLAQSQQTVVPLGLGAGIAQQKPNFEQGLYAGAGEVGDQLADEIGEMGPDGPIVRLNAGKLIGVLFTENVQRF